MSTPSPDFSFVEPARLDNIPEGKVVDAVSCTMETRVHSPPSEEEGIADTGKAGSVSSVLTDTYLQAIYDREARDSARRNIEWLRSNGYTVKGELIDGQYTVRFSSCTHKGSTWKTNLKGLVKGFTGEAKTGQALLRQVE